MKAQTKALIASAVVLALALSAVSGITYSWFSDTERSDITVETAKVDYDVGFTGKVAEGLATIEKAGTSTTGYSATFDVSNIAAKTNITIDAQITNSSTIKTVYQVVLTPSYTAPGDGGNGLTPYDLKNILVQTSAGNTTDLVSQIALKGSSTEKDWTVDSTTGVLTAATFGPIVIKDWTEVAQNVNPWTITAVISTPTTYGGTPDAPIVAFDPSTGDGSTAIDTTYTKSWDAQTARSGLSFELKVVAVQGDYSYTTMDVDEGSKVASATLPENKVITAEAIQSSGTSSTGNILNVILDFSNAGKVSGTAGEEEVQEDTVGMKVTAEVKSVDESTSTVTVDLNLYKVTTDSGGSTDQKKIEGATFDEPVVITMTVPGALTDPKVVYSGSEEDGTVLSSTISGSGASAKTTIVFSVKHFSEYNIMDAGGIDANNLKTLDELRFAMATGGSYKLGADLKDVTETIWVKAPTVLDLGEHTISTSTASYLFQVKNDLEVQNGTLTNTYTTSARVLAIESLTSDVTLSLENVNIVGPTTGTDDRGISVYGNTAGVEIEISGGSVKTYHYPLCVADGNSGVLIYVEGATIEGYSVAQTNSIYTEMIFNECTLNATNNQTAGSNDYSAFVFYEEANGSRITCYDCGVNATKKSTADQELITFYTNSFVEFNGCTIKVDGQEVPGQDIAQELAYGQVGGHVLLYPGAGLEAVAGYDPEDTYPGGWLQVVAWKTVTNQESLTEAVNAGGYVMFSNSITGNVVIPADTYVILNLRGYTLTASSSPAITNNGILELVDSNFPRWGTVVCTGSSGSIIQNNTGGELYFQGGAFAEQADRYLVNNYGECTIYWGGFTGSLDKLFQNNDGASMSIEGGYFSQKPEKYIPDEYEAVSYSYVRGYSWTVSPES